MGKRKELSKEFLENEELLNSLDINVKNSKALCECITKFIDDLQPLKELNEGLYYLGGIEQMERINTMLYGELAEIEAKGNSLYSNLEQQEKVRQC